MDLWKCENPFLTRSVLVSFLNENLPRFNLLSVLECLSVTNIAKCAEEMVLSKCIRQKTGSDFNNENNDQDVLLTRDFPQA